MSSKDSSSTQSKRPSNTAFKQQRLKAWQPILTPKPVILSFLIIGIVFIPIGAGIVYSSNQVQEYDHRYDNTCDVGKTCTFNITVTNTLHSPVFLYYRLENLYQNHRRYVKSRNDVQLKGGIVNTYSSLTDCAPFASLDQDAPNPQPQNFYNPCGLIARSLFNDTFQISSVGSGGVLTPIALRKDGIAWTSDKNNKFGNPPANAPGIRMISDFQDEDFIVWMRTAGLPDFKKLYRIIDTDINPGTYTIRVQSNYPVASFNGQKHFVMSTTTWIGGKNPFLGYAYIVVGAICFLQAVIFAVKHKVSPRKLGDTKYLEWNK